MKTRKPPRRRSEKTSNGVSEGRLKTALKPGGVSSFRAAGRSILWLRKRVRPWDEVEAGSTDRCLPLAVIMELWMLSSLPPRGRHTPTWAPAFRRGLPTAPERDPSRPPFPGPEKRNEGNSITTMPDAYPAGSAWRWERHVCEDFGSGFKDHGSKRVLLNILRGDNFYEIKLKLVGVIISD